MAGADAAETTSQVEPTSFGPGFTDIDFRVVAATQRKNAEAIVQISQLALDGMQHAWRRQLDFVREAIDELSSFMVDLGDANGSLDRRLSRQAEYSKQSFDRMLVNARELTELTSRATHEAMSLVGVRLSEGLDELRRSQGARRPTQRGGGGVGWRSHDHRPDERRRDPPARADDLDPEATLLPHLDEAYNLARWLTPSAADAEAAVERGVMKALAEYRSFRDGDPRIWVLRSVRDTACVRAPAPAAAEDGPPPTPGDWSALAVLRDAGLTPQTLLARVQARHLDALVGALPVELREVIVLFELNGASYREVATITGVPVSTVMSRLWQARCTLVRLAGRLDDEEIPSSDE